MASTTTPESKWVLVYDWSEKLISRIPLDRLRENAYQVFPIPRPSYMLEIYGLRMNLSSHSDFEEIHVINMPPGFSDTGHRSHASTPTTPLGRRLHPSTPRTTSSIQRSYATSSYQYSYTPDINITIPDITSPDMTIPDITTPDITTPDSTMSSALPQKFASNIPSTSEPGSSSARIGSSIPSHDFHGSNTQSTSDLSELSPNILQAIREGVIRVYPSSTGWYDAAFTVRWELDQYLETELDFDPKTPERDMFEPMLTITGTGSAAYATTARSYVQREWPDSRVDLLHHLQSWACARDYIGKSFVLSFRNSVEGHALLSS